jgi:hypothetical protein
LLNQFLMLKLLFLLTEHNCLLDYT